MSTRKNALRTYFHEVIRDMLVRGVIRQRSGQTLDAILRAETPVVIDGLVGDLTALAGELGMKAVDLARVFAERQASAYASRGAEAAVSFFKNLLVKK